MVRSSTTAKEVTSTHNGFAWTRGDFYQSSPPRKVPVTRFMDIVVYQRHRAFSAFLSDATLIGITRADPDPSDRPMNLELWEIQPR
jgi:hypothetical protein